MSRLNAVGLFWNIRYIAFRSLQVFFNVSETLCAQFWQWPVCLHHPVMNKQLSIWMFYRVYLLGGEGVYNISVERNQPTDSEFMTSCKVGSERL